MSCTRLIVVGLVQIRRGIEPNKRSLLGRQSSPFWPISRYQKKKHILPTDLRGYLPMNLPNDGPISKSDGNAQQVAAKGTVRPRDTRGSFGKLKELRASQRNGEPPTGLDGRAPSSS